MNAMIPDVMQLLTFYSVCPASTAAAECSFSRDCAASRATCAIPCCLLQRLVSLMLLFSYPETLDTLNIDKLLNEFIIRNE